MPPLVFLADLADADAVLNAAPDVLHGGPASNPGRSTPPCGGDDR